MMTVQITQTLNASIYTMLVCPYVLLTLFVHDNITPLFSNFC